RHERASLPALHSPLQAPRLPGSFLFLFLAHPGGFLCADVLIYGRTPICVQCNKGGHLGCGGCVALLPGGQCRTCEDGNGFFHPCPALDAIVSSTKIACPHAGCQTYVPYHEAADHQSACPHAPCACTETGCGFVGAPHALAGHLADLHSVPVRTVQYGRASQVPVSGPRQLLVGEEDGRAFLLTVGALGAAAAAVSVVCIRQSAATQPRFSCKMW
uniref:SIAH-type domain-containing protein n=1 Tax=Aegilops tauschii subsp. strangulata TaxID=200361 RepID=A0A453DXM8_AEGTS